MTSLPSTVAYLRQSDPPLSLRTFENGFSAKTMVSLFQQTSRGQLDQAISQLRLNEKKFNHQADAWNATTVMLTQAAMAHMRYFQVHLLKWLKIS